MSSLPPPPPPGMMPPPPSMPSPVPASKKPIYKRWWFITIAVVFVIGIIGGLTGGDKKKDTKVEAAASTTASAVTTAAATTNASTTQAATTAATTTLPPTTTTKVTTTTLPPTTTAPPQPKVYDGRGDDVVKITKPEGKAATPVIAKFTHNGKSNFIVTAQDAKGDRIGGVVNVIGAYSGSNALDFDSSAATDSLVIKADGAWHIELLPLASAPTFTTETNGRGDSVVLYQGARGTAAFTHTGKSNFIVTSYASSRNGLINEIGAYSGRVPLAAGPLVIVVRADGDWTINVT